MSKQEISKSLNNVIRQFRAIANDFAHRFPLFIFAFLALFYVTANAIAQSPSLITTLLCLMITVASIAIYIKSWNYGETILAFMLGVFTVFSISWDTPKAIIFVTFFVIFTSTIFIISCIKLAAARETILKQAATYLDIKNVETNYKEMQKMCSPSDQYGILGNIEKAAIVRYLSFRRVTLERIKQLLIPIEMLTVISDIDHMKVAEFIHMLDISLSKEETATIAEINNFLDELLSLPCTPEDFFTIFGATRKYLVARDISPETYLEIVRQGANEGRTADDISVVFGRRYEI